MPTAPAHPQPAMPAFVRLACGREATPGIRQARAHLRDVLLELVEVEHHQAYPDPLRDAAAALRVRDMRQTSALL
jgi:hypothetical protein